jgi:uncharacterized membrane protein YphA (DoxX/SURF4 family)
MAARSRALNTGAWIASALLFLLFVGAAARMKLTSAQESVDAFHKYGYSDTFRLFIGTCELLGGVALLIPRLATWSAAGLFIIMLGAMHAHLTNDESSRASLPFVVALLLVFVAYVRRPQALFLS